MGLRVCMFLLTDCRFTSQVGWGVWNKGGRGGGGIVPLD